MNFVEELTWRGMIHDMMPGLEDQLKKEVTSAYVGIDPTADSLHIGHLVGVMMLKHFQLAGHKPIVLVGGATGMIGDPSGKSQERNLLDEPTLRHNQECLKVQISKFLDFESKGENAAEMVNNYDWMKDFTFLNFIRDIGKHIKIFTILPKEIVDQLIEEHQQEPHLRQLQKVLAKEVTCMVHSEADYNIVVEASEILFGKGTEDTLRKLDEATFLSVFEGVPQFEISKSELEAGINIIDLLAEKTSVFPSKGEARRTIAGGGVAVNKVKIEGPDEIIALSKLIGGKYLLVQKGKKNYFLLIASSLSFNI